ncbi:MAG TPA: D-amino acid aminotransferase [Tepidisphaeraceae bacterium]|jgi:D-alanine transaminase|nr:D-amino acid aminotransferase [Tepidisphaeraceae bacterium]
MSELIWINGEIQPLADARIGVEDRGFQFADGVYEVIRLYKRKPFALDLHLQRLEKSAAGIQLSLPIGAPALTAEIGKFLAQAAVPDGMIYLQLTRGCAPRNHAFSQTQATLLFYVRALPPVADAATSDGLKLVTVPDERWKRCWIKSIGLLPNVLAKNQALAAGADEAVFVENDLVTECSASNIFAVIGGRLVTHPVGGKVLPGITRAVLLELAPKLQVSVDERAFSEEEARHADELFITSTTREISWVAQWNGRSVGDGRCGPITLKLVRALREKVQRETA